MIPAAYRRGDPILPAGGSLLGPALAGTAAQGLLTYRTGATADRDGGTTGIGVNQTLPVPEQGRVTEVGSDLGLS